MMTQQIMTSSGSQLSNVNGIVTKKNWKIKYNPKTNIGNGMIETDGPEGYRQFIIEDIKNTDIKNVLMPKNINKNTIEEQLIKILPKSPTRSRRRKLKTPTRSRRRKLKTPTRSRRRKPKTPTKTQSRRKPKKTSTRSRRRKSKSTIKKKIKTIKGLLPDKLLKTII